MGRDHLHIGRQRLEQRTAVDGAQHIRSDDQIKGVAANQDLQVLGQSGIVFQTRIQGFHRQNMIFGFDDDVDLWVFPGKSDHGAKAVARQVRKIDLFQFRVQSLEAVIAAPAKNGAAGSVVEGHEQNRWPAIERLIPAGMFPPVLMKTIQPRRPGGDDTIGGRNTGIDFDAALNLVIGGDQSALERHLSFPVGFLVKRLHTRCLDAFLVHGHDGNIEMTQGGGEFLLGIEAEVGGQGDVQLQALHQMAADPDHEISIGLAPGRDSGVVLVVIVIAHQVADEKISNDFQGLAVQTQNFEVTALLNTAMK